MAWEARLGLKREVLLLMMGEAITGRLTRLTRLGKHLRLLFQHDLVTQGLQAAHGGVALTSRVQRLEEVRAQIMVVLVGPQHLVDDGQ